MQAEMDYRVGQGVDVHPFADNRKLVIGGVEIPHSQGLLGHSDADVLLHAIIDALFGAAGLPDIGEHFSNKDPRWAGISSLELLRLAWAEISSLGYTLSNLDCTLLAEKPRLSPYIQEMKTRIAEVLAVELSRIGIKATTTEKLGFVGRGEGVLASAVALLACRRS